MKPATDVAAFLGGVVAAEGSFTHSRDDKFTFAVQLGARDARTCELLRDVLDTGHIRHFPRRKAHYDDVVVFVVRSMRDHLAVTIPFMDAHLPPSYKREQYRAWRAELLDYWEHRAKRVRPCTIEGCEQPRRAHGLCRRHLYEQRGI